MACGRAIWHCIHSTKSLLLQGPLFETQGQQPGSRVLSWIQRMLTAPPAPLPPPGSPSAGPAKVVVAQTALLHLLSTNLDLFSVCVDQCYGADATLTRAYFQVSWACTPGQCVGAILDSMEMYRSFAGRGLWSCPIHAL